MHFENLEIWICEENRIVNFVLSNTFCFQNLNHAVYTCISEVCLKQEKPIDQFKKSRQNSEYDRTRTIYYLHMNCNNWQTEPQLQLSLAELALIRIRSIIRIKCIKISILFMHLFLFGNKLIIYTVKVL